jgi:hypothetical protein
LLQQQAAHVLVQASVVEPDEEPDDEDALPDEEPVLPDDEPVLPEEEPDADPEEEPDDVGPELELLEQATAPRVAADAPMPTTTMT